MTTRRKREIYETLKVVDFKKPIKATVSALIDVETRYGDKTIMQFTTPESEEPMQMFLNAPSQNDLIDAFGEEDEEWIGRKVVIGVEKSERTLNQNALVVKPQ